MRAELCTITNAMGKIGCELLHFPDGFGHFFFHQHAVVGAHNLVAILFCGLEIISGIYVFVNLPENPGIGGSGTANHHGIASGFLHHSHGVFRSEDISIADHRNFHSLLHCSDASPVSAARVTLFTGPGMQRDSCKSFLFGNSSHINHDQFLIIPPGPEFHGEWDSQRVAACDDQITHKR